MCVCVSHGTAPHAILHERSNVSDLVLHLVDQFQQSGYVPCGVASQSERGANPAHLKRDKKGQVDEEKRNTSSMRETQMTMKEHAPPT